jgi:hypothetical protein
MAMSKREKLIASVTGAAMGLFALDRYAITPYFTERKAVADQLAVVTKQTADATRKFREQRRLQGEWRNMISGGLKSDAGDAEQQLYESVRDWAREAGVAVTASDPQRVVRPDRTQVVRLRVTGSGTTAAFSKLLWKVETSPLPLKVDEFTLTAQPPGADKLAVTLWVSTIWVRPAGPDDAKKAPAPVRRPAPGTEDL